MNKNSKKKSKLKIKQKYIDEVHPYITFKTEDSYSRYLKSSYWKKLSGWVKEQAGFRCQMCNFPEDLNVHHRDYSCMGNYKEEVKDLICVCKWCHGIFHKNRELFKDSSKKY